jgi:hypothetical protein
MLARQALYHLNHSSSPNRFLKLQMLWPRNSIAMLCVCVSVCLCLCVFETGSP